MPGGKLRFQTPWIEGDHGSVFSPDESAMATYRSDATMQLRSTADGKVLGTFGRSRQVLQGVRITYTLAFAPDGKAVAQWDDRQDELILWNTATGKVLWELPVAGDFSWIHVAWSPDGRMLAVANAFQGDTIILVEAATGKVRRTLRGHAGRVWSLAFSPDGRLLAVAAGHAVWLWDTATGEPRGKLRGHTRMVTAVAFTPDGRLLASAGTDGQVKLWDVAAARERAAFDWQVGPVTALALAPDGMRGACGGAKGDIAVWDLDL